MKGGGSFPSSLIMYVMMVMLDKGRIGLERGGEGYLILSRSLRSCVLSERIVVATIHDDFETSFHVVIWFCRDTSWGDQLNDGEGEEERRRGVVAIII